MKFTTAAVIIASLTSGAVASPTGRRLLNERNMAMGNSHTGTDALTDTDALTNTDAAAAAAKASKSADDVALRSLSAMSKAMSGLDPELLDCLKNTPNGGASRRSMQLGPGALGLNSDAMDCLDKAGIDLGDLTRRAMEAGAKGEEADALTGTEALTNTDALTDTNAGAAAAKANKAADDVALRSLEAMSQSLPNIDPELLDCLSKAPNGGMASRSTQIDPSSLGLNSDAMDCLDKAGINIGDFTRRDSNPEVDADARQSAAAAIAAALGGN